MSGLLALALVLSVALAGPVPKAKASGNGTCWTYILDPGTHLPSGNTWECTYFSPTVFTVPAGVTSLHVKLFALPGQNGAWGSNCPVLQTNQIYGSPGGYGGLGAVVEGDLPVTPGDELSVVPGATGTQPLHGGAGGQGQVIVQAGQGTCNFDRGGNGGTGGGAAYIAKSLNGTLQYLVVAGGGGGGGGGNDDAGGCGPGSAGGDVGANGKGLITFHCTGDVVGSGGGAAGDTQDGNGGAGYNAVSLFGAGGGGGGGGGMAGGDGALGGSLDGGAGGGGGSNLLPSGFSSFAGSDSGQVWIFWTDNSTPNTSIQLSGTSPNHNGSYTSSVGVAIGATDPDDSVLNLVNPEQGGPNPSTTVSATRCVLDPASAPASFDNLPSGQCSLTNVSNEGHHTIYVSSEDFAGNKESVQSVSFTVDKTAPTTTISPSPSSPNGSNGWYTGQIGISTSAQDSLSAIAQTRCVLDPGSVPGSYTALPSGACAVSSVSGDGQHTVYAASQDGAGNNETPVSKVLKIDGTPPTDSPLLSGSPGNNGWWTSDVSLAWQWSDATSGIDAPNCTTGGATSGEGTALTISGSCKDLAGNSASDSLTFKVDKTKPTISAGATTGPNGTNGWYTSNVTVHFVCADNLSGVVNGTCPADQTLSSEGSSVSSTAHTVSDNAGNTSDQSNVVTVKIDKTAPSVAVTGVSNGAQYTYGNVPAAGCTTSDAVSGVATPATVSVTGGQNGAGLFTATCSGAVDNAGNAAAPVSVNYTVLYAFGGFITPAPKSTLAYKPGTTTPVTFVLTNASGQQIGNSIASTLSGKVSVTLSGQGITPVTAPCSWNFVLGFFQCSLKIPTLTLIGSGNPYQITAYEDLGGGPVTVPPYSPYPADANPETVYFK